MSATHDTTSHEVDHGLDSASPENIPLPNVSAEVALLAHGSTLAAPASSPSPLPLPNLSASPLMTNVIAPIPQPLRDGAANVTHTPLRGKKSKRGRKRL